MNNDEDADATAAVATVEDDDDDKCIYCINWRMYTEQFWLIAGVRGGWRWRTIRQRNEVEIFVTEISCAFA